MLPRVPLASLSIRCVLVYYDPFKFRSVRRDVGKIAFRGVPVVFCEEFCLRACIRKEMEAAANLAASVEEGAVIGHEIVAVKVIDISINEVGLILGPFWHDKKRGVENIIGYGQAG